ncbi:SMI1/KNR4 family protein [Streptomyces sp. NBC_00525]|uniref:SMI1/KNR4 family protein n=1 Tax=Streptomyces sp. NBC_00525 TaxID=2903660 RepID=UPI002E81CD48|nr:SMI1/KNR4 family protein [Streptomyces sp. NBC_00525]WUC95117.1 SMI1/KNR4 family protein [Streptomyces sp. NBC_00525]
MPSGVGESWQRVVSWLRENAQVSHRALGDAASEAEIAAVEEKTGVRFPADLRTYLKVNNGTVTQLDDSNGLTGSCPEGEFLAGGWALLPLSSIERLHHQMMPGPNEDVAYWRKEWIPFAAESYACGEMYGFFIDAETGSVGQWSDGDVEDLDLFADLPEFFASVLADLERILGPEDTGQRVLDGRVTLD